MTRHVRRRRRELDWTQEQLAQKVGISRQTLVAIERGRSLPGLATAMRLARHLDRTVAELFPDEDEAARIEIGRRGEEA